MRTTGKFPAQKMPRSMAGPGPGSLFDFEDDAQQPAECFRTLDNNNLHGTHLPVQTVYAIVCRFWAKCHICVSARVSTTTPLPSLQESRAVGSVNSLLTPSGNSGMRVASCSG